MKKQTIDWVFYPKNSMVPSFLKKTIGVFEDNADKINSFENDNNKERLSSDEVLHIISGGLEELKYKVEKSKKKSDKIRIPVLFGKRGLEELAFEADAYQPEFKTVVEVEAGRAFVNFQFLKDIFQASMMLETEYLVLAVRNIYTGTKDFEKINSFLEAMYLTNKIKLDLKGILLIGY